MGMKKTIILLFTLFACDPPGDTRLKFANNSSFPIIFTQGPYEGDSVEYYKYYDCTSSEVAHNYVEPGEIDGFPSNPGGNWERLLVKANRPFVFIAYRADSAIKYIDNFGCDSLGKRKDLVLKRFDVTVDYLNRNNWALTYP